MMIMIMMIFVVNDNNNVSDISSFKLVLVFFRQISVSWINGFSPIQPIWPFHQPVHHSSTKQK